MTCEIVHRRLSDFMLSFFLRGAGGCCVCEVEIFLGYGGFCWFPWVGIFLGDGGCWVCAVEVCLFALWSGTAKVEESLGLGIIYVRETCFCVLLTL